VRRPRRKLEFDDGFGNRIVVILEGRWPLEKVRGLVDLLELYVRETPPVPAGGGSKLDRLLRLLVNRFPHRVFTSEDVAAAYEEEYREPITRSTVATYLRRLADRGVLVEVGRRGRAICYRVLVDRVVVSATL